MRIGVDTNVLVYAHMPALPEHAAARRFLLERLADPAGRLVIAPMILHELIHVITDARRFDPPVLIPEALSVAKIYLGRENVECLAIDEAVTQRAFALMERHRLGRRRLADTLFAAALLEAGVEELATCNASDFALFEGLRLIDPLGSG